MTDLISKTPKDAQATTQAELAEAVSGVRQTHRAHTLDAQAGTSALAWSTPEGLQTLTETIELMFFAYRDFTGEADAILEQKGFGRAHHRVIYFVTRHPGLSVADLLGILKITKQSLARVLKQLIDEGYIDQRPGPSDRRRRLLFATQRGADLAQTLTELQMRRIADALDATGPDAASHVHAFLEGMISKEERAAVRELLQTSAPPVTSGGTDGSA